MPNPSPLEVAPEFRGIRECDNTGCSLDFWAKSFCLWSRSAEERFVSGQFNKAELFPYKAAIFLLGVTCDVEGNSVDEFNVADPILTGSLLFRLLLIRGDTPLNPIVARF